MKTHVKTIILRASLAVAAVFALSTSGFAQYSSPVTVKNTIQQAVPVKDQNNPAYQPVQFRADVVFADGSAQAQWAGIYIVPLKKTLVVEHITITSFVQPGQLFYFRLDNFDGSLVDLIDATTIPTFANSSTLLASQPVRMYLNAADQVHISGFRNSTTGSTTVSVYVKGYLVDYQQ